MSKIRPISPAFRSIDRKHPKQQQKIANLPVVADKGGPRQRKQVAMEQVRLQPASAFAVQLLAKPEPRGIRASSAERNRYFGAYSRPAPQSRQVQEKWA